MTAPEPGVVILGSGLGGYTLAREFRKLDRATPLTVVTFDGGEVYSKPMLSNAFAQGKDARSLAQKTAAQAEGELSARVLTRSRAVAIDRTARLVAVEDAEGHRHWLAYRQLVLAVGADPRPYRVEGDDAVRIFTVNNLDDYAGWREALPQGGRLLLIGAGLIGSEFADDLAGAGYHVEVVDPAPWPLGRLAPEVLGRQLAEAMTKAGITLHLNRSVVRLSPGEASLDDGSTVAFDRILSAIGLVPRTELARQAGLAVGRGIVVDRMLATSDPAIFAIGDCAETTAGPLPFVLPLMAEARALAATLAGKPTPLVLPALPVVVKTRSLPIVVCPPAPAAKGEWQIEGEGRDLKALFVGETGQPLGFAVSGALVGQRQALAKEMPALA